MASPKEELLATRAYSGAVELLTHRRARLRR